MCGPLVCVCRERLFGVPVQSDIQGEPRGGVRDIELPALDSRLSGHAATPDPSRYPNPRALIIALPGGGLWARYFHVPAEPSLSLLTMGRDLGYSVLALNRPGYGPAADIPLERQTLEHQAAYVSAAVESYAASHDVGAGIVLVGQSFGFMVSFAIAGLRLLPQLVGVDGSGVATRYLDNNVSKKRAEMTSEEFRRSMRQMLWADESFYPPGTFDPANNVMAPLLPAELSESARWIGIWSGLVERINVPVQITYAEKESSWDIGPEAREEFKRAFACAPSVEVRDLPAAGHNLNVSWSARAYNLQVFAFVENCILVKGASRPARPSTTWKSARE